MSTTGNRRLLRTQDVAAGILGLSLLFFACRAAMRGTGPIADGTASPPGMRYYLPHDVIEVSARKKTTTVNVPLPDLSGPDDPKVDIERSATVKVVTLPDTRTYHLIDLQEGRMQDASLEVNLSDQGLLSGINLDSKGRVGDVVKTVAQTIGTIVGIAGIADSTVHVVWPNEVDACRDIDLNTQDILVKLFVKRNVEGCTMWLQMASLSTQLQTSESELQALQLKLAKAPADEVDGLLVRIRELEKSIRRVADVKRATEAAFNEKRANFLKSLRLNQPKVEEITGTYAFEVKELPPASLVKAGMTSARAKNALDGVADRPCAKAAALLDSMQIVVTTMAYDHTCTPPERCHAADALVADWGNCDELMPKDAKARFYYRETRPAQLTLLVENNDRKELAVKDQPLVDLIDEGSDRCLAFKESSMANNVMKIEFDAKGRPKKLTRSTTSEVAGVTDAIAGGVNAAVTGYTGALDTLIKVDDSQRKLALSDLTTEVERIKKEKELLDTQIAIQGTTANRDLVLQQQQLTNQLAILDAQLKLQQASAGFDAQLELAVMKLDLERLKQQLAILEQQAAIKKALEE